FKRILLGSKPLRTQDDNFWWPLMNLIPKHLAIVRHGPVVIRTKELEVAHPAGTLHKPQPIESAVATGHQVQTLHAVLQSGSAELDQISLQLISQWVGVVPGMAQHVQISWKNQEHRSSHSDTTRDPACAYPLHRKTELNTSPQQSECEQGVAMVCVSLPLHEVREGAKQHTGPYAPELPSLSRPIPHCHRHGAGDQNGARNRKTFLKQIRPARVPKRRVVRNQSALQLQKRLKRVRQHEREKNGESNGQPC